MVNFASSAPTKLVKVPRKKPDVHPSERETETPPGYIRVYFYLNMGFILRGLAPDLWADVKLSENGGLHLDTIKDLWSLESCMAVTDTCDEFVPGTKGYLTPLAVHNLSVHTCISCRRAPLYEPDWECKNHKACILFVGTPQKDSATARSFRPSYLIAKEIGLTTGTAMTTLRYKPIPKPTDVVEFTEYDTRIREQMERRQRYSKTAEDGVYRAILALVTVFILFCALVSTIPPLE